MSAQILYVEDNPLNRTLIRKTLQMTEYRLIEAQTGAEGIEKAAHLHPDLILLDFHLPDMKGVEVARFIRQHPEIASTPIIALTADSSEDYYLNWEQIGLQGYLVKPVHRQTLLATIKTALLSEPNHAHSTAHLAHYTGATLG